MSDSPTGGHSPLFDMRCKLTAAEQRIEQLESAGKALLENGYRVSEQTWYFHEPEVSQFKQALKGDKP